MNTKDLLLKLAGNDATKQKRAEQWANLFWCCRMDLTEAQGKVLLNEPCVPEEAGTVFALCWAINLREPVFLKTAIDILWDTPAHDGLVLSKVLDVLNEDAQRQLLKNPDAFMNLLPLINEALQYRNCVEPYELWKPCGDVEINSVYRAAWYVVDSRCYYESVITERYSLKKLKAALKTPERIDRYAQIEHVEYDYSTGCLKEAKEVIEALNIPEFEPIWFKTSEDVAAEGSIMRNCIAGYWNEIGTTCVMFACIYKGTRIDLEIGKDSGGFLVKQCFEKSNKTTDISDELLRTLDTVLQIYTLNSIAAKDASLLHCKLCRDAMVLVATGEIVVDYVKFHHIHSAQIHGVHPITGVPVVYKIVYSAFTAVGEYYILKDITGTDEVYPWTEEYADFEDEDDDFADYDEAFEPQFLDDYELFD